MGMLNNIAVIHIFDRLINMIAHPNLSERRQRIADKNDKITERRIKWIEANPYYYRQLINNLKFIIRPGSKILHLRCSIGYILNELTPSLGVGVDTSNRQVEEARRRYPHLSFQTELPAAENAQLKFDYVLISSTEDIVDIKGTLDKIKAYCDRHTRVVVVYYNYLWNPLVKLAERSGLKIPQDFHNWVSPGDVRNLLRLSNYEEIAIKKTILSPFNIPLLSYLANKFLSRLPFFRWFNMMNISVSRLRYEHQQEYSVSIVIPCKNEAGNIEDAVKRIPKLGAHTEIIFGDDKSTDGTPDVVREMMKKYPDKTIRLVDSPGISKAQNVWTCFDHAKGDILMILDADLTVIPEELPYFYEAISKGYGEFINGSRLLYPMRDGAMPFFNVVGNKFFSIAFTYLLGHEIKDTLCGTKVMWRDDYQHIKALRGTWGVEDRWCDYELIFGAAKNHLKIVDLPVHYMERTYGETKMTNRFRNGRIMLRMCLAALTRLKFY